MKLNVLLSTALLFATAVANPAAGARKNPQTKEARASPLDIYVREAAQQAHQQPPTEGSVWTPVAQFADLGRDLIASRVNDLVTIVVSEQASAVSTGASETSRTSTLNTSITGLLGV